MTGELAVLETRLFSVQIIQKTMLAAVSALVMGFASVAHASDGTGFELGARVGYGIPVGDADEGNYLRDYISGEISLWVDVGYRLLPELFVGAYFQYGFGFAGTSSMGCGEDGSGTDCSVSDIRLGVQAHYHIMPGQPVDPWVGLGLGYEWLMLKSESPGLEVSTTARGFEFVNLQAGADYLLAPEAPAVGPFISFSVGQYAEGSSDCPPGVCGISVPPGGDENKALHQWLLLGIRGDFVL